MLVTTSPAQLMACWPKLKRSTRKAKQIAGPRPQATVRQRMRLRSVEPSQAASSTARIPSIPVNRSKVTPQGQLPAASSQLLALFSQIKGDFLSLYGFGVAINHAKG